MIGNLLYLISSMFFIISIHKLSSPDTARNGNYIGILGMTLACLTSLLFVKMNLAFILTTMSIIGLFIASIVILISK